MPEVRIAILGHPLQAKAEGKEMMHRLLPILILLLFASCASATTLHGTLLDVDTGAAVSGVYVHCARLATHAVTDSSGKFDLTIPLDTETMIYVEEEDPCYCTELWCNPPLAVSYYYPDTDEIWEIIKIPSCSSDTDPSAGVDPEHPGPGPGPGINGTTPGGMTPTSTAGWWGAGLIGAVWTTAILALTVIVGAVALPSLTVIAGFALFGALVCMMIFPAISAADIPILSWLTGSMQDAGNAVWDTFGFHFNTTDPKTFGEAGGDGVATIAKTITDAFTRVFVDAVKEATGLSESMIWLLTGAAVIIGLLMLYNRRQNQSMVYLLSDMQNRVKGKK